MVSIFLCVVYLLVFLREVSIHFNRIRFIKYGREFLFLLVFGGAYKIELQKSTRFREMKHQNILQHFVTSYNTDLQWKRFRDINVTSQQVYFSHHYSIVTSTTTQSPFSCN